MISKKLVIIVGTFPKPSETFIVSNIIGAIEKGYEVRVLVKEKKTSTSSTQEKLLHKYQILEKTICLRYPIKTYKCLIFGGFCMSHPIVFWYFLKYIWVFKKIDWKLLFSLHYFHPFRKTDIIHVHFGLNAEYIPMLKQIGFIKSKLLVTFHGYDAFFKDSKHLKLLNNQYEILFQMADKITVNTPFLKQSVLALGCPESKITVIPIGVNLEYFKPTIYPKKISTTEFKLISVGRLIEIKGHEFGIRVVKNLLESGYSVSYIIIGEGILHNKLQTLIVDLGIQEAVTLIGKASQETIRENLEEAQLYLMTSIRDATGREETQGVVTAEAQSMGLPIVGFDSGGVPYTVSKDTGIIVEQKDIEAMANAIASLITNPKKYSEMSLAARKWVAKEFDLNNMISNYYNDLV